jgi:hypothetical protein
VSNDTYNTKHDRSPKRPRRTFLARRPRTPSVDREGWLLLASSGWYVRLSDVLDQPTTAVLAGEDTCWQFAVADWRDRRPRLWRLSARSAWRFEGRRLDTKRERLVEMTRHVRTLRPKSATAS